MNKALRFLIGSLLFLGAVQLQAHREVILEFKGAADFFTNRCTRNIFNTAGFLFGPEITVQLCEDRNWYGFLSVDFLDKNGCTVGLATPTKVQLIPVAFGFKYLKQCCWYDSVRWYLGAGLQPIHVRTKNCSPYVQQRTSNWGMGAILKAGAYINLDCMHDCMRGLVLDLFVNYSGVSVPQPCICSNLVIEPRKAKVSTVILGGGLGYSF